MTKIDRVGNSDNFNFSGVSIVSASLREELASNTKKRWNVCTAMMLLYIYSKISGVRGPICSVIKNKVLMLIEV